jgi:hypothetical protein
MAFPLINTVTFARAVVVGISFNCNGMFIIAVNVHPYMSLTIQPGVEDCASIPRK